MMKNILIDNVKIENGILKLIDRLVLFSKRERLCDDK